MQSWWYGCLGKQEIVGPSTLILPTLHLTTSCCGHRMVASDWARWRAWTVQTPFKKAGPGTTFTVCGCELYPTSHLKKAKSDSCE